MRFNLVDRIVSLEAGKSITAVKTLSLAEEYLADHFPGYPVMPGALMLETMVQAGAWLMRFTEDFRFSTVLLKSASGVRFNSFVSPGQTLTVTADVQQWNGRECVLKAQGTREGESVVKGRIRLEQFNLAESDPKLAESDRLRVAKMREIFSQMWSPGRNQEATS